MSKAGYVFHTYGSEAHLRYAVASVATLRRHDRSRPVALYCSSEHKDALKKHKLSHLFERIELLPVDHQSIIGFKHHLYRFMPYERNLFVDVDIVWCRSPDSLWRHLSTHPFTVTGLDRADLYFGGPKNLAVLFEYLANRRGRTMKKFGLTYLPRVQAGVIYASDAAVTRDICEQASDLFARRKETHFRVAGGTVPSEESCEWGLAMAMARNGMPVYPWYQGYNSPQLDFIPGLTQYTEDFEEVTCKYYCDRFVYEIRGLKNPRVRDFFMAFFARVLRRQDYFMVTPYMLHFSWSHAKAPFIEFANRVWACPQGYDVALQP